MTASRLLKVPAAALLAFFLLPACRPGHAAVEVLAVRDLDLALAQARQASLRIGVPEKLRESPPHPGLKSRATEGVPSGAIGLGFLVP